MEEPGSQIFTFTWRIENFSMCPQQMNEYIASPSFVVDFLENTEWKLRMYPRGDKEPDYVSVFLERATGGDCAQSIAIIREFSVLSTIDGKDIKEQFPSTTFESGVAKGRKKFCTREKIFEHESGLLPNGILTLRCWMGACVNQEENVFKYRNADLWNSRSPSEWYECSARTRVKVSSTSFVWPIKQIDELPCDAKLWTCVPSAMKSKHSFNMFLELKDSEGNKKIQIGIREKNECKEKLFARCHIKTVGAPKNVLFQENGEWYFDGKEENKAWIFPTFLTIENLTESYFSHTDDNLYLQFHLSFTTQNDVVHFENISEKLSLCTKEREISCAWASNFENLYNDEEFADATLRVRDREYKVHKVVLIAGSDVFRRMFVSGMKEQNSGIVEIDDLDPDTVERLLKYIYTHKLDKLNIDGARKLYSAADKYNMGNLKCRLRSYLTTNLSVDRVCETLVLSDAHHDEDLLSSVIDYIDRNAMEILRSNNWKDFANCQNELAWSTMLQILTKK